MPTDTHTPTAVEVDDFGPAVVSSTRHEEVVRSVVHVGLPTIRRGADTSWTLDLYPDEALELAAALINHARVLLT